MQNVYFRCSALAYFLYRKGCQKESTVVGCFKCKQTVKQIGYRQHSEPDLSLSPVPFRIFAAPQLYWNKVLHRNYLKFLGKTGQQYVHERYIHNIICWQSTVNEENIKIEGKPHESHWNHQAPQVLRMHMKDQHSGTMLLYRKVLHF